MPLGPRFRLALACLASAVLFAGCAAGPVHRGAGPVPLAQALGDPAVRGPLRVVLDPATGATPVTPLPEAVRPVAWLPGALVGYEYYLVHDPEGDPPVLIVRVVGRCENGSAGSIDFSAGPPEIRSSVLREALAPTDPATPVSPGASVFYGGCRPTVDPGAVELLPPGPDGTRAPTPAQLEKTAVSHPDPDPSALELVPPRQQRD